MNKILTRVCTVMLAGSAAIGLAYATEAVVSHVLSQSAAKEAAEEVTVYSWGVQKPSNYDGWTGDINALIEADGNYDNCLSIGDYANGNYAPDKVAVSKGLTIKKNTNYKISFATRTVGTFTPTANIQINLQSASGVDEFAGGTKVLEATGVNANWNEYESSFNSGNLEGAYYIGIKIIKTTGMVSKVMFSDVTLIEIAELGGGGEDPDVPTPPEEKEAKTVPFAENFTKDLGECTAEDANADGVTWAYYMFNPSAAVKGSVADDWLFTPAIKLEAGKTYLVSFKVNSSYGEVSTYDVKYGDAANSESMTNVIAEGLTAGKDKVDLSKKFTCNADGEYNLGFHATSEKSDNFYFYGYSIEETTPDLVTYDIPYEADFSQELSEIGFTVIDANEDEKLWTRSSNNGIDYVSVNYDRFKDKDDWLITPGLNLESGKQYVVEYLDYCSDGKYPEKLEIKYGSDSNADAMANVLTEPYAINWTFTKPSPKQHKFLLQWNEEGPCFIGFHAVSEKYMVALFLYGIKVTEFNGEANLLSPENLSISNGESTKDVVLSWDAVTKDEYNRDVTPSYVIEMLKDGVWNEVAKTAEATITFADVVTEGQGFVNYRVKAIDGENESEYTEFASIAVGESLADFAETFPLYGECDVDWLFECPGACAWTSEMNTSADFSDFSYSFTTDAAGKNGVMTSPLIVVPTKDNKLTFYIFNESGDAKVKVEVREAAASEYTVVSTITVGDLTESGWGKAIVDFADYAGKDVQVRFTVVAGKSAFRIDNIKFENPVEKDVLIKSELVAPKSVAAGEEYSVSAEILNVGSVALENVVVKLYVDADSELAVVLDEKSFETFAVGEKAVVEFNLEMSKLQIGDLKFKAVVECADDMNQANNSTSVASISPLHSSFASVNNLAGKCVENGILLEWDDIAIVETVATAADSEGDASSVETGSILGYDVYRNGELIAALVDENSYFDELTGVENGGHDYHVVAHYENGVSAPQHVYVLWTSVNSVDTSDVKVIVSGSKVIVLNADGKHVSVVAANGALLYNGNATACLEIDAAHGLNIIRIADKAVKVLVK